MTDCGVTTDDRPSDFTGQRPESPLPGRVRFTQQSNLHGKASAGPTSLVHSLPDDASDQLRQTTPAEFCQHGSDEVILRCGGV